MLTSCVEDDLRYVGVLTRPHWVRYCNVITVSVIHKYMCMGHVYRKPVVLLHG